MDGYEPLGERLPDSQPVHRLPTALAVRLTLGGPETLRPHLAVSLPVQSTASPLILDLIPERTTRSYFSDSIVVNWNECVRADLNK